MFHVKSGMLKIERLHQDGHALLVNLIVPGETIPHHSLITPKPYFGTAVGLVTSEVEVYRLEDWYRSLEQDPVRYRTIALQLQDKLRMMQVRIDQLSAIEPIERLRKLQRWFEQYISPSSLTDVLTQVEIGQLIGLRRETVNRLLRQERLATGPKNS
ncbi:Crp/Fnr family transcriptional regulator [Paenibacillus sp. JCM 10914]|nr:cAMP-dependent protein kinase regulatory chain [Paenibacillus sp. JCM 10914]